MPTSTCTASSRTLPRLAALTDLELVEAVQEGLPIAAVDEAIELYELTTAELEAIIPRRTLARRRENRQPLSVDESNRLERLVRVFSIAEEALGSLEKARLWMRRPNRALLENHPMAVLDTDRGARLVESILGRMAHGVHS